MCKSLFKIAVMLLHFQVNGKCAMINIRPDLLWNLARLCATKYNFFFIQNNSQTSSFSEAKSLQPWDCSIVTKHDTYIRSKIKTNHLRHFLSKDRNFFPSLKLQTFPSSKLRTKVQFIHHREPNFHCIDQWLIWNS